ncbi:MAG: chemotaxis protein CheW [Candidatus Methylomirabilales bacterium]
MKAALEEVVQLLAFTVARRFFALELLGIVEIIEYKKPTRTPKPPPFVEGVIEHRGQMMPLVSLRKRLGAQEVTRGGSTVLLFQPSPSGQVVGLLVDAASQVITFEKKALLEPPPRVFGIRAEFIKGIATLEGRPVIWLDVPRLLSSPEEIALV